METLLSFIQDYGYLFIFFAAIVEGETVLALAGFTAFQGFLDLETVILVAFLGGLVGDQSFFYFGRLKGKRFLESRPKLLARVERLHRLIERHQNLLIFGSRFMYGFRTILPITFGTSNVSGYRFLWFDLLGGATWSIVFGVGGYMFGTALEQLIGHIHKTEKFLIIGVLVGALLAQVISFVYRKITVQVEKGETE